MQTLAVVGITPPKAATRGDVRARVAYVVSGFSRTELEVRMFDDSRWDDSRDRDDGSDRDSRDRDVDPCDVFLEGLDLPRGLERELVHDRDREYTLRGSESRTLSVVGAFRVVSSRDLLESHRRDRDGAHDHHMVARTGSGGRGVSPDPRIIEELLR